MDIVFNCPNCKQELAVEESAIGQEIACPSCREVQLVPDPKALPKPKESPLAPAPAGAAAAAALALDTTAAHSAHKPRGLSVPQHAAPSEILIKKATPKAALDPSKHQTRIKCIRRISCTSVGQDRFDEVVGEFLAEIGEAALISINPISYGFVDGTGRVMPDYGVMIVYKD